MDSLLFPAIRFDVFLKMAERFVQNRFPVFNNASFFI